MVRVECAVCLEEVDFAKLRFFRCGHSFCVQCTDRITSKANGIRRACPTCRHVIGARGEAQRLHVAFCESHTTPVSAVMNALTSVDPGSTVQVVHQARSMYHQFCSNAQHDWENVLRAKEEMEMRILSALIAQQQQAREAPMLRATITGLSNQVDQLQSTLKEVREELDRRNRELASHTEHPQGMNTRTRPNYHHIAEQQPIGSSSGTAASRYHVSRQIQSIASPPIIATASSLAHALGNPPCLTNSLTPTLESHSMQRSTPLFDIHPSRSDLTATDLLTSSLSSEGVDRRHDMNFGRDFTQWLAEVEQR